MHIPLFHHPIHPIPPVSYTLEAAAGSFASAFGLSTSAVPYFLMTKSNLTSLDTDKLALLRGRRAPT
ncbi:hypothetical protein BCR35DRAFT_309154 [Leucosporidium creatinivorum]|uniref:Uncharacterized protein n=1 Tax=Leucosporidium creatinivorum TaxID=106004 RepID=A0A1Y2DM76_9BASI|nr:hypothetical protein BCR35DRAFT_309154 [Leucosporidium creatinivorum]